MQGQTFLLFPNRAEEAVTLRLRISCGDAPLCEGKAKTQAALHGGHVSIGRARITVVSPPHTSLFRQPLLREGQQFVKLHIVVDAEPDGALWRHFHHKLLLLGHLAYQYGKHRQQHRFGRCSLARSHGLNALSQGCRGQGFALLEAYRAASGARQISGYKAQRRVRRRGGHEFKHAHIVAGHAQHIGLAEQVCVVFKGNAYALANIAHKDGKIRLAGEFAETQGFKQALPFGGKFKVHV